MAVAESEMEIETQHHPRDMLFKCDISVGDWGEACYSKSIRCCVFGQQSRFFQQNMPFSSGLCLAAEESYIVELIMPKSPNFQGFFRIEEYLFSISGKECL